MSKWVLLGWIGCALVGSDARAEETHRGAYARLEARFERAVSGNPFDHEENDLQALIRQPDGRTVAVPAFFDDENTWRVRFTPDRPGTYTIDRITRNGQEWTVAVEPSRFTVTGPPTSPGFVRIDRADPMRFTFDDGTPYYPIGINIGWGNKSRDVPGYLQILSQARGNWSRIWMCHWDGKNLDWPSGGRVPPGTLSLPVARYWDRIVETAEAQGIRFQMTLQHHGPYSSTTDSNWKDNPWNRKNGGWLDSPAEFFTDERARALTRRKYRYIVARWGYSPSILAWELFNEVQWCDAWKSPSLGPEVVGRWHREMAAFLRQHDPFHHLVTTSSELHPEVLWRDMDYYQPHAYVADPVHEAVALDRAKLDRPYFFGEMGPAQGADDPDSAPRFVHRFLWASLMSGSAGAAEYWYWDQFERHGLDRDLRAAVEFVTRSGLATGLRPREIAVVTAARGPLSFAPGGGWGPGKVRELTVPATGAIEGLEHMQRFLHGEFHRDNATTATFRVTYPRPGTFAVKVGTVAASGAKLTIDRDGTPAVEKTFAPTPKDAHPGLTLSLDVPAGAHTIRLANTGKDWVTLDEITLNPYAPALRALGKSNDTRAVAWVERSEASRDDSDAVLIPSLRAGHYRAVWWDSKEARPLSEQAVSVAADQPLRLAVPAHIVDAGLWIEPERR